MQEVIRFMDLRVGSFERKQCLNVIDGVLASGAIINGSQVEAFERQAADYCGTDYAVGVGSGTAALYLALKALGIGRDDEVILPVFGFVGTANAVVAAGATPVFVDVRDDLLINPAAALAAITSRTRAIIPVHFTGNVCDMDAFKQFTVIEDAAPAFGATYRGKKAGTFGRIGCFSMNPMKVLGAIGEAGVVVTQSSLMYEKLRGLRYHGIQEKDLCLNVSLNARLDTIQAAVLSIRLRTLENDLKRRRSIAQRYTEQLSKIVETPKVSSHVSPAWYHYAILCDQRDKLTAALQAQGIETRVYHSRLMPEHPAHKGDLAAYPVGRKIVDRILCLPMHARLRDDELVSVALAVAKFYGRKA